MANLFKIHAGAVIKTNVEGGAAFIRIDGLDMSSVTLLACSFQYNRAQITLHQKSFSNDLYSYAFGDAPGKLLVGGYAFLTPCEGSDGLSTVNGFYQGSNIYTKESPCTITLGTLSVSGYLENLTIIGEPNPFNYGSFNLGFTIIPQKS